MNLSLSLFLSLSLHPQQVQTGGGITGKMWGHEHWGLTEPPDIVSFSKRTQVAGYFMKKESHLRPKESYRIFNTWMGDPSKMLMCKAIVSSTSSVL